MEIRNRETGDLTTISQFKAEYPGTSFPKIITNEILDSYGFDPVLNGAQANVTAPYGISVRDGVEQIDGQWFSRFIAGPVFADIEGGPTAAEQEATYRASIDTQAAARVREDRNRKLAASDWTQMADSPLTDEAKTQWATYRTDLRNLPDATGWPHTMTWPTEPS